MNEEIKTILPALRRFAFSLTGNMPDADDLMQNTIERMLTKGMPKDVEIMAWAFRICRNLWIDEYRAQKVRQNAISNPDLQEQTTKDAEHNIAKQDIKRVSEAMNQLPMNQKEVLGLVAVQGMSYKEAADILSVPTGTIMSRLARARAKLIDLLHLDMEVLS